MYLQYKNLYPYVGHNQKETITNTHTEYLKLQICKQGIQNNLSSQRWPSNYLIFMTWFSLSIRFDTSGREQQTTSELSKSSSSPLSQSQF